MHNGFRNTRPASDSGSAHHLLGLSSLSYDSSMSKTHSIHAAKTHLSRLVERAEAGEEVVIARGNKPVVKLVPTGAEQPRRKFGAMKGRARVTRAFFGPLPDNELSAWEQ